MTSVTCSVCTQNIATENDRVYCFGGCEQIVHVRCSELSSADSNALKNNIALKYMCFGCRKKQVCLNDMQKTCADLLKRFDVVAEVVRNYESNLNSIEDRILEKLESVAVPRILSKIEAVGLDLGITKRNDENNTYASVTRGKKSTAVSDECVITATDAFSNGDDLPNGGGLLRSGRRRIVTNIPAKSNDTSQKPSASAEQPSSTPLPKSVTSKKLDQTVIIKPKSNQSSDVTRNDIRAKLDPAAFSVKDVRWKENGDVSIRCETGDLARKFVNTATEILSESYDIAIQKPLNPRIKIIGISDNLNADEIVLKLKKQNNLPPSSNITVVRIRKNENWIHNPLTAVLETDAQSFETLIKRQSVNVGWDRCRVVEEINVLRCFKCSTYGHRASSCNNPICCPKCAGDHEAKECESSSEKCVNCELENKHRTYPKDNELSIDHSAWSDICPIYQKRLKKARQMVSYST